MTVQQSRLPSTDTTKDMGEAPDLWYADSVVSTVGDVDRGLHNRTQFVRLALTRPQPNTAYSTSSGIPYVLTDAPHYIDGTFTADPSAGVDHMIVGFSPRLVSTTTIRVFSVSSMSSTPSRFRML